jgi:hypothetical protein
MLKEMNVVNTKVLLRFFLQIYPFAPIHIFSSDTHACFALVTSHNMLSNMLHTPLYTQCVHNVHDMDSEDA